AKILYVGTAGSDDPTRAGLPFNFALGAVEAGHEPEIFLAGEAAYAMKDDVAGAVMPVAMPALAEMLKKLTEHGVPIHVCRRCSRGPMRSSRRERKRSPNGTRGAEGIMPRYEFMCEKCKKLFELIMTISEREKAKVACPTCKGTKIVQRVRGADKEEELTVG